MRVLVLCFLATLAAVTAAQTGKPAPKPAAPASRPPAPARPATAAAPARFSAAGLNNQDDFLRIYSGDFQSVRLDPAGAEFMMIISSYMNDYSTACKQFLPPDKVEITEQVCAETSTPVNGYGTPVGTSTCVSYRTVGTGRYADPQLYAAEQAADAAAAKKMLGGMLGMLTGKGGGGGSNPLTMPQQLTDQITAVGTEMQTLIHTNACGSPGLRNFQSNLIRFTNGADPIKYAGAVDSTPTAAPGEPAKDTNFARLLDDLVADNARGWMMNRYQPGSITDPIVSRDPSGRPVRVIAQYSYAGMQGTQRGRVTVSFKDGSPDCLYFSDNPDSCRLPAAGVVSAYEKNAYAK
jgi:hypothetical protein